MNTASNICRRVRRWVTSAWVAAGARQPTRGARGPSQGLAEVAISLPQSTNTDGAQITFRAAPLDRLGGRSSAF
jgi:hypothetical protein